MQGDKLPQWNFVGRCYDVLTVDPLDIEAGAKFPMAFQMDKFDDVGDGSYQKPECTEHMPLAGGEQHSTTAALSCSYDLHSFNKVDGSVAVSDPTGELFSASLSASYEQTRDETESRKKVVTYTSQTVNTYRLAMRSDKGAVQASRDLAAAVAGLTTSPTAEYKQFVNRFGTHYAHEVLFGGRIYQRIVVEEEDYSTFLEEGLNVQGEASATFEIAKGTVKAGVEDKRSQKFVNATKNSTEDIRWVGGTPQHLSDMWAVSVERQPAPIQVVLRPLYDLLTAVFFPDEAEIATKQNLLQDEIDAYIRSNGHDARKAILQYGDEVTLLLAAKGPQRYLSAADSTYARTSQSSDPAAPGHDGSLRWIIVAADDPGRKGDIKTGEIVALRSASTGQYLDAQAGSDETYYQGDGLTAASGARTNENTTRWKLDLADDRMRDEIVDGDYVRFQSQWRDPDDELGYLQGEANYRDPSQRVYSFGSSSPPRGTIWVVSRLAGE
jgi:hypothetical protein